MNIFYIFLLFIYLIGVALFAAVAIDEERKCREHANIPELIFYLIPLMLYLIPFALLWPMFLLYELVRKK